MKRVLSTACLAMGFAAASLAQPAAPAPQAHVDEALGVRIPDEYRWMESAGPLLDPWIDAEDEHARTLLRGLRGRSALEADVTALRATGVGDIDESLLDERSGRRLVLDYSQGAPRLGLRTGDGPLVVLFDGTQDGPARGATLRPAATKLSPDGRFVTLGLVERGEQNARIRILDIDASRLLPDVLDAPLWADAEGFHVAWLADSRGLLWVRNPARNAQTPDGEREFNGHVVVHRLGDDPAAATAIFGTTVVEGLRPDDTPYPRVSADGRWLLVRVRHAEGRSLWAAPFADGRVTSAFRNVLASSGTILGYGIQGDALLAVVTDDAPNHRLVRVALNDAAARPQTVVDGEGGFISGLAVADDGIHISQRDGATSSLWRLDAAGKRSRIDLPREGVIEDLQPAPSQHGARFVLRSGAHPDEWFDVDARARVARPVFAAPTGLPPALEDVTVSVVDAPSRDGELIPVSILHRKNQPRDGSGFARVEAYGCYGSSTELTYDPANFAWLDRGGIIVVAHVRGGGERGRAWHQANVIRGHAASADDAVDVVAHLVRDGWIAPGRAAMLGGSCGAATAANAALSRPDLIAAASLHVGGLDEWRAWSETASGARSVRDVGDPDTARGIRQLVAASPYHRLLPQARQPGFFVFNGATDYTIPLWMGAKFVARARAFAGPGSGPVLFRVERAAGHSGPTDPDAQLKTYVDDLAFQMWQLGHPAFQP